MVQQKTGAAKHSANYRAREKEKAARFGIEDVTITMPAGIKKALAEEMNRHGYKQVQELWQDMALSWIAQDADERARRLVRADAPAFYISPRMARQFSEASIRELRRDPGDETIPPDLEA